MKDLKDCTGLYYVDNRGTVLQFRTIVHVDIGDEVDIALFTLVGYIGDNGEFSSSLYAEFYLTENDIRNLKEVEINGSIRRF